jgi:hypothetical protein
MFWTKVVSKQTFYVQQLFFPKNHAFYEIQKDTAQPDRPQMTIQYGSNTLHAE